MTDMEYYRLCWTIVEHRVRYYYFDNPIIEDYEYDMLERKYMKECDIRGLEHYAIAPGINLNRPSVQEAILKVSRQMGVQNGLSRQ